MLKYVVGWAFAFAIEAKLVETKGANPSLCASDGADCLTFDLQVVLPPPPTHVGWFDPCLRVVAPDLTSPARRWRAPSRWRAASCC